jgi:hypothetical protein
MLYSLHSPQPARRFHKAVVPLGLAAGFLIITIAVMFTRSHQQEAPAAVAVPQSVTATSWTIHCGTDKYNKNAQVFSGFVAPGGVIFLPANAPFRVKPTPSTAEGSFMEPMQGSGWVKEGGDLASASRSMDGWFQECRAPQTPGLYTLSWRDAGDSVPTVSIEVVVLQQAAMQLQGDRTHVKINGKPIGSYGDPSEAPVKRVRENSNRYQVPRYFATLTPELMKLKFGPDFDLGQLIAYKDYRNTEGKKVYTTDRHTDVFPPRLDLIEKLVKLRDRLRQKGIKVTKFWITSGFRTPEYNKTIGGALFSRHCYGDAVDLVIDEDDDKHMDDLNGDGRIDRKDGIIIGNAVRELELEGAVVPGGIGVYEWNGEDSVRSHVHIDCRGYVSRWGQVDSGKFKKTFTWWPKAEFQEDDGE